MPKLTLLDLTQRILSSLDSDTVNSYNETDESEQVAYIIRDTYYDLINNIEVPEHRELITLTAHADVTTPTHMTIPAGVTRIEDVRYNVITSTGTDKDYALMQYVEPQVFLSRSLMRSSSSSNILTVSINGGEVLIQTDKAPEWYTAFDDNTLVFDSYDSSVDSTLQSSKFIVWALSEPPFTMSDTFTPDLDVNLFPLLLNEAKSVAHVELNQSSNPKAEQQALRQKIRWQAGKANVSKSKYNSYGTQNYGRSSRRRS
jgi:hypothetical protein